MVWALLGSLGNLLTIAGVAVCVAISCLMWRAIYEVYQNPCEITVAGDRVGWRDFQGRTQVCSLHDLRISPAKNYFYGSDDIYLVSGELAFRLYVWGSNYATVRDLIREEGGISQRDHATVQQ